jgi:hypothetical protein
MSAGIQFKFWMVLWIVVLFYGSVWGQVHKGESWATVSKRGSGTLSVLYYTQHGLMQKNAGGDLEGICVEILKDFQQFVSMNYNVNLDIKFLGEEKEFNTFLNTVKQSTNVLGVGNVTITPERDAYFDFTPPFLTNPVIMITHREAPSIKSYEELKSLLNGFKAEVIKGSTHESYVNSIKNRYIPNLAIQYQHSGAAVLDNVSKNKNLFTIMDLTEFVYATRKKLPLKRQAIIIASSEEHLGFVIREGADWIKVWNAFLTKEYRASSQFKKHIAKHLGATFLTVN